ncbi:hypothetical protein [Helicobacter macacae]|uniref:Uncharacterized protein n=1 Tax=Helicobacter macacae MIT 99-5501 TaxID=1357400 RepID=V8CDG1_9HELI|nr:hypothetical protein [Helicobacter macacae]ETD25142.1 hypothetical protein HMPREF2086_00477 [Helicobacter macacae MIT 99-5501]
MTQELEKVFIASKTMQNAMRLDPEYADIKKELEREDFKVVCFDDTHNKELFSGDKSKPIGDYEGLAIRSDLYVGDKSFYPLPNYSQNYFSHLEMVMREIADYMGACKWEFSYAEEVLESKEQNKDFDISGSVKSSSWSEGTGANKVTHGADIGVGFGYASASNSLQSNDAKFSYQHSEELIERKKNPQELADFIKEQGINLNAFDPSFKEQIRDYINGEKIGTTSHEVDKSGHITEYNKTIRKINANVDICKFFEAKFKIDLQDELKTEHRQRVKLLYKMTFDKAKD